MKIDETIWYRICWTWRWLLCLDAEANEMSLREYWFIHSRKYAWAKQKGAVFASQDTHEKAEHEACNHRKGGYANLKTGRISMGSSDGDYAIIKHQMMDGSWYIRCIRCGMTWKPGVAGYAEAVFFPTRNASSGSTQVRFLKTGKDGIARDDSARYQAAIVNS